MLNWHEELMMKKYKIMWDLSNQHLIDASLGLLFEIRINKVQHD